MARRRRFVQRNLHPFPLRDSLFIHLGAHELMWVGGQPYRDAWERDNRIYKIRKLEHDMSLNEGALEVDGNTGKKPKNEDKWRSAMQKARIIKLARRVCTTFFLNSSPLMRIYSSSSSSSSSLFGN